MARHAKNNTASSYFTYHERKNLKDYGTQQQRLGKDSLANFDWCCLSLTTATDPVVTPDGYIFSKEAIYENLLAQKKEIQRKKKLWKQQQKRLQEEQLQKLELQKQTEIQQFVETESSILPSRPLSNQSKEQTLAIVTVPVSQAMKPSVYATVNSQPPPPDPVPSTEAELRAKVMEHAKKLRAFWVPGVVADAPTDMLQKPSSKTLCPQTGRPLRLKELTPVEFTPVQNVSSREAERVGKWMCPLCFTVLTNKVKLSALKTSRKVLCRACTEKFVIPDMKDPFNGLRVRDKDIINLKAPGTGFAGQTDQPLVAKKDGTALFL